MKTIFLNFKGYWLDEHKVSAPMDSGVYCVYAATYLPDTDRVFLRELIYVGESDNVGRRLEGHERTSDWKKRLRNGETLCYSMAPVESADRVRTEAAVIHKYKPPCNTEYVSRFPYTSTGVRTSGANALLLAEFTVFTKL